MAERSIGSLFVNIIPGTKEFASTLNRDITSGAGKIGSNAGKTMGGGIASGLKRMAGPILAAVSIGAIVNGIRTQMESLQRIEVINTQTETVIKSMGNAANVSAKEIQSLSDSLERTTATEAESIQEGANLLLTFGNIRNEVGQGNDIFNQTTGLMVDMARALGTDAAGSAIQLGKALNDPIKGVTALSRVGVSFTEEQKELIKSLAESGDMLGAQKVILGELEKQFGGSGEAYAGTLAGTIELIKHELGSIGESLLADSMPVITELMAAFKESLPEIRDALLPAMQTLGKAFKDDILPAMIELLPVAISVFGFIAENIQNIILVVAAITALSQIVKVSTIVMGLFNLVMAANPYVLAAIAIAALVAGLVYFFTQTEIGKELLLGFFQILKDTFTNIASFITTTFTNIGIFFQQVVTNITAFFTTAWTSAVELFTTIISSISVIFQDVFNGVTSFFKGFINTIIGFWEGFINFFINGVNMVIGSINSIKLNVPEWLQGLTGGAKSIGFNIPSLSNVSLPRLAEGGVVMPQNGGVLAQIAEAGQPEAVIPLNKLDEIMGNSGRGDTYVYNAAENRSLSTEEEFVKAAKRTRLQVVR